MATAYVRLRLVWGPFDLSVAQGQTPNYGSTQIVTGGPTAAVGSGIGVRRASLYLDRTVADAGADPAFMHFDFLNTTGGVPDDTWTNGDFTQMETALNAFWNSAGAYAAGGHKLTQIIWHRVGTGVSKPNPAERILTVAAPALGGGGALAAPQHACSITFRTGVRRSWGRTYLPIGNTPMSAGRLSNTATDAIAGATNTLFLAAASNDFHPVVVSGPLASSLNIESVEVDNVTDVIRRRRWKRQTYRKILP